MLHAGLDITQISTTVNRIPESVPEIDGMLQTSEESTGIAPAIVSGYRSWPIMISAIQNGVIPVDLPSSVEFVLVQPCRISRRLGSLSSSLAAALSDSTPQITSVLPTDAHVMINNGALGTTDNPRNLSLPLRDHGHGLNEL